MGINNYRLVLERKKGQREQIHQEQKQIIENISKIKKEILFTEKARLIIQEVGRKTQESLEFHISELVTLAMASVFSDPYVFRTRFIVRRNVTECDLFFERSGQERAPLAEGGGGAVDVASFGLRSSLWSLQNSRNVLILDEPFRNVNDPTRKLHEKLAKMIKMVSEKLGLQIIMISLHSEFKEISNQTFTISLDKRRQSIVLEQLEEKTKRKEKANRIKSNFRG